MQLLPDPTIYELVRAFLRHIDGATRRGELSEHTRKAYEASLRIGVMEYMPRRRLSELRRLDFSQMHAAVTEDRGPCSGNNAMARAAHLIDWGIDVGMVPDGRNPAKGVKPNVVTAKRYPLSAEDARKISRVCWLALASDEGTRVLRPHWAGLFLLYITTGMRRNEGTHLRRSEWDSANRLITIHADKSHRHRARRGAKVKQIPANTAAAAVLDLLEERDEHPVWFFPSYRSRTGHVGDPSEPWKRVLRTCGVDTRTRIHDIRHGFARAAYEASKDVECVAGLLGHLNSRSTSLYIGQLEPHVVAPASERAVELLVGELKAVSR